MSDYEPMPPSDRHRIADELAAALHRAGLAPAAEAERSTSKRCYLVLVRRDDLRLRGVVRVYGPDYVRVDYAAAPGGKGGRLFGSAEAALTFLRLAFVDGRPDEAAKVPERIPKRRPKSRG